MLYMSKLVFISSQTDASSTTFTIEVLYETASQCSLLVVAMWVVCVAASCWHVLSV